MDDVNGVILLCTVVPLFAVPFAVVAIVFPFAVVVTAVAAVELVDECNIPHDVAGGAPMGTPMDDEDAGSATAAVLPTVPATVPLPLPTTVPTAELPLPVLTAELTAVPVPVRSPSDDRGVESTRDDDEDASRETEGIVPSLLE